MKNRRTVNVEEKAIGADKLEAWDAMGRPVNPRRSEVRLGREVQARIGQQLRAMYEDFVRQGVPSHIDALVRRLTDQDDGTA